MTLPLPLTAPASSLASLEHALTLTQPWAGLVASGIKLVENRPRRMIAERHFGKPFAIHASREIDESVYARIWKIAPELQPPPVGPRGHERVLPYEPWRHLARVTSAIIGVAVVDKVFGDNWDEESIAKYGADLSFSSGERLGPDQVRWFFGPVAYVLRDVIDLPRPVPCKGKLGFWRLPDEIRDAVVTQLTEDAA
jgi:hypothetical protein